MLGKISVMLLLVIICCKEKSAKEKTGDYKEHIVTLWVDFKKNISCTMTWQSFEDYCKSNNWKSVRGTTGISARENIAVEGGNDSTKKIFGVRTFLVSGSEKDSAKLFIEVTDSTGSWLLNRCWYSKKSIGFILQNSLKIVFNTVEGIEEIKLCAQ